MATYKQIQKYIREKHGFIIQTCWIAHVKELCNLNPRTAPNRHAADIRTKPCPENKIDIIKNAFKYFGML